MSLARRLLNLLYGLDDEAVRTMRRWRFKPALLARKPVARPLHWSSYFRVHHRQVGQLRVGRIFIAGDAAHIHSPFGGQGMNTGLHDVWNLVWKLDLLLHGRGNDGLLWSSK